MFHKLKLYKQLILIIGLLSIVLLGVFGILAFQSAAEIVTRDVTQNSQTVLQQINAVNEQWIGSLESMALSIARDSEVMAAIKSLENTHGLEQVQAVNTINNKLLFYQSSRRDVMQMSIFSPHVDLADYYQTWHSYYILNTSSPQYSRWKSYFEKHHFGLLPIHEEKYSDLPADNYITFYWHMNTFPNEKNEEILLITLREQVLGSLIATQGNADDIYFIVDENYNPISYGMNQRIADRFLQQHRNLFQTMENQKGISVVDFDAEKYCVIYSSLNRYGVRTIQLKPYGQMLSSLSVLVSRIWVVGFLCLLAILPLIVLFSKQFVRPLHSLIAQMKRVGSGSFEFYQDPDANYTNEIGDLNHGFQQMTNEIKAMLQRVQEISEQKTLIEFEVLQQQINPHFLYNTLDFINWMAIKAHVNDISTAVVRLGEFLRLNLSNGIVAITIDEELRRIAAYMELQNLHLKGRIRYLDEVPLEVREQQIIRLVLQPFIENAILHGFSNCEKGEICVSGWVEENDVYLQISDNGCGFSEERGEQLLKAPKTARGSYGVYNVNKRLQLYYGTAYGIKYLPVRKGTTVLIHIPKNAEVRYV